MVTEAERHDLYAAAEGALGEGPAATLMELLVPVDWSDIARRSDIAEVRAELNRGIAEVRGEVAAVRGELHELKGDVRLQIGELYQRLVTAYVLMMVGLAGLVFTVANAA